MSEEPKPKQVSVKMSPSQFGEVIRIDTRKDLTLDSRGEGLAIILSSVAGVDAVIGYSKYTLIAKKGELYSIKEVIDVVFETVLYYLQDEEV